MNVFPLNFAGNIHFSTFLEQHLCSYLTFIHYFIERYITNFIPCVYQLKPLLSFNMLKDYFLLSYCYTSQMQKINLFIRSGCVNIFSFYVMIVQCVTCVMTD